MSFSDPRLVRYGIPIKIRHAATGHTLHSHGINYKTGSYQQEVTCFGSRDDNDWWVVKSSDSANTSIGVYVPNHSIIRLEHLLTRKNLHSHPGFFSPSSRQGEVTAFGDNGVGDNNDNWKLEIQGENPGEAWRGEHRFRLIHCITNQALHSHHGHKTASLQQEVTTYGDRDDNDFWMIEIVP